MTGRRRPWISINGTGTPISWLSSNIVWAALLSVAMMSCACGPTFASDHDYEAVVTILTTNGTIERSVILTTKGGVSRKECNLRRRAWLAEHGDTIKAAQAQFETQGKYSAFEVSCERMR